MKTAVTSFFFCRLVYFRPFGVSALAGLAMAALSGAAGAAPASARPGSPRNRGTGTPEKRAADGRRPFNWKRPADGRRSSNGNVSPIARMTRAALDRYFLGLSGKTLAYRLEAWSRLFLGAPYHVDPLGEGPTGRHDTDPLMDFSRVDCMSFVEQVIALSYSRDMSETLGWLVRLRYREGRTEFERRHYTMVKGWIRQNTRAGFLKDITRRTGGRRVRSVSLNLDRRSRWLERHRKRFQLLGRHAPKGVARVKYIPLNTAIRMADRFPHGALMHVVSELDFKSPYLITHVGFVFRKAKTAYFRHASRSPDRHRVEDRTVRSYLRMLKTYYGRNGRRRVLGVHVTRILSPRRSRGRG